jgi:hypothetical protein
MVILLVKMQEKKRESKELFCSLLSLMILLVEMYEKKRLKKKNEDIRFISKKKLNNK